MEPVVILDPNNYKSINDKTSVGNNIIVLPRILSVKQTACMPSKHNLSQQSPHRESCRCKYGSRCDKTSASCEIMLRGQKQGHTVGDFFEKTPTISSLGREVPKLNNHSGHKWGQGVCFAFKFPFSLPRYMYTLFVFRCYLLLRTLYI